MKQNAKPKNYDERYSIVEDAICDAFLSLAQEKDPEQITVADLVKKAGIVRSTFYNHYENVPDLISAMEDRTLEKIFHLMEEFHPKNNREICEHFFLTLCRYTRENIFLANLIRSPKADGFLEKALEMFHQYAGEVSHVFSISKKDYKESSYVIACSIGCTIGILHKWTSDQFDAPEELIAKILAEVFMKGMLPLLSH